MVKRRFIINFQSLMRALPAEEKAKIAVLAESLAVERSRLEREITQWDETGNDIIVLAKKMCMMMMEMSDFTRGQGPLKTTMDVIEGAKVEENLLILFAYHA